MSAWLAALSPPSRSSPAATAMGRSGLMKQVHAKSARRGDGLLNFIWLPRFAQRQLLLTPARFQIKKHRYTRLNIYTPPTIYAYQSSTGTVYISATTRSQIRTLPKDGFS